MSWEKITELISRLGFPTAVAAYLLYRWDAFMVQLLQNQTLVLELLRRHVSE